MAIVETENRDMEKLALELYEQILKAIDVKFTDTRFAVDSSKASEIIAKAGFSILLMLQELSVRNKFSSNDILRLASCKTAEELKSTRDEINIRNIASGEIQKLVNAELVKRNKPIAVPKKRA